MPNLPTIGSPTDNSLAVMQEEVKDFRSRVALDLRKFDETRKKLDPNASSYEEVWNNVVAIQDTNQLVRENLNQMQVVLHRLLEQFYARDRLREEKLAELLSSEDRESLELYHLVREEHAKERMSDVKCIDMIANTCNRLANEHRQCLLAKKYYYHSSMVQGLLAYVASVLHQEIHNVKLLDKISAKVRDGIDKFLPHSADEDS